MDIGQIQQTIEQAWEARDTISTGTTGGAGGSTTATARTLMRPLLFIERASSSQYKVLSF